MGVGDDGLGDAAGGVAGEVEGHVLVEALHEEVVDHLLGEVTGVLEEVDVALHVAGEADPAEDLLAEAVDGGDGGGVELGDHGTEALVARHHRLTVGVAQLLADLVGGEGGRVESRVEIRVQVRPQVGFGADQSLPHPVAQLARGGPGERNEQERLDR